LKNNKFLLAVLVLLYFILCNTWHNLYFVISFALALLILHLSVGFLDLSNREKQNLFLLASAHLVITVSMIFYMPPILAGDAKVYWNSRVEWLLLYILQNSLYPFIIKIFNYIHRNSAPSDFAMFQSLFSALNVPLMFCLARKVHSKRLGITAAVIAAFWIPYIEFSSSMLITETFSVTLGIFMMIKLIDCLKDNTKKKNFALLGLLMGISFLLKYSFYIWFLSILGIAVFYSVFRQNIMRNFLIYLGVFYLVAGVFYVRNYFFYGSFSLQGNGASLLETTIDPYPGMVPNSKLTTYSPYHVLDSSKLGTGSIYSIPIVTYYSLKKFTDNTEVRSKVVSSVEKTLKNQKSKHLEARARKFLYWLIGANNIDYTMYLYKKEYRASVVGKEFFKFAKAKYMGLVFTYSFYKNTFLKMGDYITYPTFGRLTYYYEFAKEQLQHSEHYINPLFIFFEHYILLFFTVVGCVFSLFKRFRDKKRFPDSIIALAALSFLHLLGFSLAAMPEPRYSFPILPFLFIVASYGFVESIKIIEIFLERWNA